VEKDEALALSISEGGADDATHDEVPAEGSSDIAPEVASAPIEPPQAVFKDTETTSLSALGEEAIERPKSPWTPSYSVSIQGKPVLETPEEASNITEDKTVRDWFPFLYDHILSITADQRAKHSHRGSCLRRDRVGHHQY